MSTRNKIVGALLTCGILAMLVYAAGDVLASWLWESYRLVDRSVSELMAVGSPTRDFILPFMATYNVLVLAFGIGVTMASGGRRSLRVTGALLIAYGVISFMGLIVFPLRPDSGITSSGMGLSGVLHSAATASLVLLMFAFMVTGSGAAGRGFRIYSFVSIAVVLGCGILAGSQVERIASGEIVSGLGLLERASIYGSMLWVAALAVVLLRANREPARDAVTDGAASAPATKQVTVFVGSPHRGGATFEAARKFAADLDALGGTQTEVVALADHDLKVCRGCKLCFDRGEEFCPLKDDRDLLLGKLAASDGVVFAAPNYSFQVSAVMKIFLDRLGYMFHRPQMHGKTYSAIVVQGIYGGRKVRKYLEFVGGGLGFTVVPGSVIRTLLPMTPEATTKMDEQVAAQAQRFHSQLMLPGLRRPSVFELMMFRLARTSVRGNTSNESRDYAYFAEHGWFDSDYYYAVDLGVAKRMLGSFFDWAIAKSPAFKVADAAEEPADDGPMTPERA